MIRALKFSVHVIKFKGFVSLLGQESASQTDRARFGRVSAELWPELREKRYRVMRKTAD